jgi:hypothetical protein
MAESSNNNKRKKRDTPQSLVREHFYNAHVTPLPDGFDDELFRQRFTEAYEHSGLQSFYVAFRVATCYKHAPAGRFVPIGYPGQCQCCFRQHFHTRDGRQVESLAIRIYYLDR